jgi:hypothetical protein
MEAATHTNQNTAVQCTAFKMPANRASAMEEVPRNGEIRMMMTSTAQSPAARNEIERIAITVLS